MAKKKFVVDIDMGGNEVQNANEQNLASAPAGATEGRHYWNTSTKQWLIYNGNAWVDATNQGRIYTFSTGLTETSGTVTLNEATDSALGGVIVGDNISVNNGTISVAAASTTTKGLIEIATDTEASAETATNLAVVPKQLSTKVTKLSVKPTAGTYTKVTINAEGQVTAGTSLAATDVTNALGYTPYSATNPAGYITAAALADYVPNTRTINGKALNANITLDYSDVGALSDQTTINDLTTSAQQAALNCGITSTLVGQITTNQNDISTINGKIPSQASSSNQLADKAFVHSTVQTNTANFRGNWASWAAVPTNASDYPEDYAGSKTPTVNDYLIIQDASDYTGQTLEGTWRFKYTGDWATLGKNGWMPEYQVNETPMTAEQLAALNSGITSTLVGQITTNQNDIASIQGSMVTASSTTTFTNKTINAEGTGNSITNLKTSNFKSGVIVTTVGATGSDTSLPTEQAVREALTALNNSVVHKIASNNPAMTASGGVCTWTISNTLGTADVVVSVYEVSTGEEVFTSNTPTASAVTIKINSSSNISAGTYRAVIVG